MDPPSGAEKETGSVRLRRSLCYGSEGATYRAREPRKPCLERAPCLTELLEAGRGGEAVQDVRCASLGGGVRSSALFALAAISQHSDAEAKRAAYGALRELCASPGKLFVQYKKELSGAGQRGMWGRALRKAVADWYNSRDPLRLARDVTACKRKAGWSHKDLFRLAHLKPANDGVALVSKYVSKGWKAVRETYADGEKTDEVMKVFLYLEAVEKIRHSSDELEVVHLIEEHKLEKEHVLTKHLKSREVWKALLKEMSISTLFTLLGKMTVDKLVSSGSADTATVCERIQDEHTLLKSKTHPLCVLLAAENYKRGRGKRGKLKWKPNRDVVRALDTAFRRCLSNVESTGKRFVVGVDVSSRLDSVALGSLVDTVTVAAALSMVIARTEPNGDMLLFSDGAVVPCVVSLESSLLQITVQLVQVCSGGTDCSLPISWAAENGKTVDVFIIITNNETRSAGSEKTGVESKLVVCGLTANIVGVAHPDDRGMLDICGFDLRAVDVMRDFIAGAI